MQNQLYHINHAMHESFIMQNMTDIHTQFISFKLSKASAEVQYFSNLISNNNFPKTKKINFI